MYVSVWLMRAEHWNSFAKQERHITNEVLCEDCTNRLRLCVSPLTQSTFKHSHLNPLRTWNLLVCPWVFLHYQTHKPVQAEFSYQPAFLSISSQRNVDEYWAQETLTSTGSCHACLPAAQSSTLRPLGTLQTHNTLIFPFIAEMGNVHWL